MAWQYTTAQFVASGFEESTGAENYKAHLNSLGLHDWELVSAVTYPSHNVPGGYVVLCFLKRQYETLGKAENAS